MAHRPSSSSRHRRTFCGCTPEGHVAVKQDQRALRIESPDEKRERKSGVKKATAKKRPITEVRTTSTCRRRSCLFQGKNAQIAERGERAAVTPGTRPSPRSRFEDAAEELPALLNKDRKAEGAKVSVSPLFLFWQQRQGDDEAAAARVKGSMHTSLIVICCPLYRQNTG